MLASNGGSSGKSMGILFEEFSKLAEQLQNIQPEYMITYKNRIKESSNGLQNLWITNSES